MFPNIARIIVWLKHTSTSKKIETYFSHLKDKVSVQLA